MRILFVCTANSCRSPMADLYFNRLCRQAGRADLEAASAGIYAGDGFPISRQAAAVMAEYDIDASGFRSARFTPELARTFDLLLAMTESHRMAMREIAPSETSKIHLLSEKDIPDPFGGNVECYTRVFEAMKPALDALFQKLSGEHAPSTASSNR